MSGFRHFWLRMLTAPKARLAQLAAQDLLARADCNDSGLQASWLISL